ncbi:MAG TPA: hypothetical protein VK612_13740, partial [Pyrinomonadaceae bacterium]|nr:hypothetical protein [Pyrinomonadaceae bacterium]
ITAGHGRALLLTDDPARQRRVAKAIIEMGLSVRAVERMIKKGGGTGDSTVDKKAAKSAKDPNIRHAETKLMRNLGTNVKISPKGTSGSGKIEIEYYNTDDLDRLFQRLLNSKEG